MQPFLHFVTPIAASIAATTFAASDSSAPALLRLVVLLIGIGGGWLDLARLVIQQRAR